MNTYHTAPVVDQLGATVWSVVKTNASGENEWQCDCANEALAKRIAKWLNAFEPDKSLARESITPF